MRALLLPLTPLATGPLERLMEATGPQALGLLVLALLLGVVGVPVPEEAVYAAGGWLAHEGRLPLMAAFLTAWGTLVVLDLAVFEAGRRLGPAVRHSRLGRRVSRRRWASLRLTMRRRGVLAVALARFAMGVRIPTFLLAGAGGMPRGRFMLTVAVVGFVSGALPFALGYLLADHFVEVVRALTQARWAIAGVAAVLLIVVVAGLARRGARVHARG